MTILVFGGQNDWTITTTHEGTNVTVRARPLPGQQASWAVFAAELFTDTTLRITQLAAWKLCPGTSSRI